MRRTFHFLYIFIKFYFWGIPRWLSSKNISACECRRFGFDPWAREDALEKEMATHSSIFAWEIPWTEEPGGLRSMGLHRVGHDLVTIQQHSSKHYALSFKKQQQQQQTHTHYFFNKRKKSIMKKISFFLFFFFKVSRKWIPHSDILTHTLCLWHGHRHHGGGGTPRQTHGCSLPRSVRAWNAGPLNLCNSHSEGCKVALLTHTHRNTKRTLVFI